MNHVAMHNFPIVHLIGELLFKIDSIRQRIIYEVKPQNIGTIKFSCRYKYFVKVCWLMCLSFQSLISWCDNVQKRHEK